MNGDLAKLPPAVVMTVAKACLSAGKQTAAQEIMKNLVQSNPESTGLHAQISTVLRDSGAGEVAETLVAESIREMIQLNNEAVLRANPEVALYIGRKRRAARARISAGEERAALWAELTKRVPTYAHYQSLTTREIPVVILEIA